MDIFSKRPLFLSCMLFLACSVAGYFLSGIVKLTIVIISVIVFIFGIILAIFKYHSSDKQNAFLLLLLCIAMIILSFASSLNYYDKNTAKYTEIYNTENMAEAVVTSVKYESSYSSIYEIDVHTLNGKENRHKALLECEYSGALRVGDAISFTAVAKEPEDDPGMYNERADALSNNIFVVYSSTNERDLDIVKYSTGKSAATFLPNLNSKLSGILTQSVKGEAGNLSSALLLGNKSLLSASVQRDFKRVGASHILALSGMHMSIITGFIMMTLKRFFKRNILIVILSCFSIFYLALTGFSVSATRSVIMLLIFYVAFLVSGIPDSLTSLSFAGFLIVLFSPGAILDAGFWLSFSATLAILVFVSSLNDHFQARLEKCDSKSKLKLQKFIYSVISAIFTCFAAIIPLMIIMCIFIKEISVLSVISSLALSLPTAAVIILSILLLPLAGVPFVSDALAFGIRTVAQAMIDFCSALSDYDNIVFSLNYPFATFMALALLIALLYAFVSRHKRPFISMIPFLAVLLVCIGTVFVYEGINSDNLKVSYINASQNSDILVVSDEREAIICDISNGSKTSYRLALDKIYEARATEIKAIVLTRYTNAHVATLYQVFAENKVRSIWCAYPSNSDEQTMLERIYEFAKESNVDVYVYTDGERLQPLEEVYVEHTRDYIDRSVVPIDLISIYSSKERLTYVSPAFNESELHKKAEYYFQKSKHVIFGNRGPNTKTRFEITNMDKIKTVTFASETLAGYFIEPEFSFASYYIVPKEGNMKFYLAE